MELTLPLPDVSEQISEGQPVKARYTLEFKREAVRLVRAIARTLGYVGAMAFEKNWLPSQQKQAE